MDLVKLLNGSPMDVILNNGSVEKIIEKTSNLISISETSKYAKDIANQGFEKLKSFLASHYIP